MPDPSPGMLSYRTPNDSFNSSCHQLTGLLLPSIIVFASYNQEYAKELEFTVAVSMRTLPEVSFSSLKMLALWSLDNFINLGREGTQSTVQAQSRY